MNEEYVVGYEAGYLDGWNAAVDQSVRTKDLTDDEIAKAMGWGTVGHLVVNEGRQILLGARAVIAADREKNK